MVVEDGRSQVGDVTDLSGTSALHPNPLLSAPTTVGATDIRVLTPTGTTNAKSGTCPEVPRADTA